MTWLVLPEVHVVDVNDVDNGNGKSRHQYSDGHRAEDRGNQGHDERDGQGNPIRLRTLAGAARHDR